MTWLTRWSPVYLAFFGGWFLALALERHDRPGIFGAPSWVRPLVFVAAAIAFVYSAIIAQRKAAPRVG